MNKANVKIKIKQYLQLELATFSHLIVKGAELFTGCLDVHCQVGLIY